MSELAGALQSELPEQYSLLGQGAQYRAVMLTGPEDSHVSIGTPYEESVGLRVLKLPLWQHEVEAAVSGMNIPEPERPAKVRRLIDNRNHSALVIASAIRWEDGCNNPTLRRMFASPRLVATDYRFGEIDPGTLARHKYRDNDETFAQFAGYTQEYVTPVSQRLAQADDREMRQLVDDYVALQRKLIAFGYLESGFKFADNCGITASGDLVMFDFGELTGSPETVYQALRGRKWEEIAGNIEYTQLPPHIYEYFCDAMEQALPAKTVDQLGSGRSHEVQSYSMPAYDIIPSHIMAAVLKRAGLIQQADELL